MYAQFSYNLNIINNYGNILTEKDKGRRNGKEWNHTAS